MRRLTILAAAFLAGIGMAIASAETLYLKNGSVIKGEIVEQVPGKSLKIKTRDGNIFVYSMDDVEKIAKESDSSSANENTCNIRHKGLDFSIGTGYNIATKGGSGSIPVDLVISKRFSPNFSLGLGAGVMIPSGDGKPVIPMYADFKGFIPLNSTKITPFGNIQIGYGINTAGDITVGSGKHAVTVESSNYIVFSVMPGVRFPLNHRTDVDFSVGYQHYMPTKGDGGSGAIAFKIGFNFHRSTDPDFINRVKPETYTHNSGFEFGIEGYAGNGYGGDILLGYKLSPRLSFALGAGYGTQDVKNKNITRTYFSGPDATGDVVNTTENTFDSDDTIEPVKVFLRGQYRLNDNKFSPFASVDLGYRTLGYSELRNYISDSDISGNGMFVRPAIGISWRTTKNSYLEARIGYEFTNGISKTNETHNYNGTIAGYRYDSINLKQDSRNFSGLYVSIGWKRTFGLFSRD